MRLLPGKKDESTEQLRQLRALVIRPFSYLTALVMATSAIVNYMTGGGPEGHVAMFLCLLVVINVHPPRIKHKTLHASAWLTFAIGALLLHSFYFGNIDQLGLFWLAIFPIPAVMLLGSHIGGLAVSLFTAMLIPALIYPNNSWIPVEYDQSITLSVMLAVNVVTLLMFFYERVIGHFLKLWLQKNENLHDTTQNLEGEIKQRERIDKDLREALDEVAAKNRQLEELTLIDEAAFASIGEAVLIMNNKGKITKANPSSGRILGVNYKELINSKLEDELEFKDIEGKEDVEEEELASNKAITHRVILQETYQVERADKSVFYAQMTASPLVVDGKVFGAAVVIRDVTQEVNVDQAKTEFVSIASHQLRTPLSTISWYLEMILAEDFGKVDKEQKEYIDEAYQASRRMDKLIDALLNVSRLDVGVYVVTPKPLDLKKEIKDVIDDLQQKIHQKKIDLKINISSDLGKPKLDDRLMNIILTNLISNAVKYTPEKGKVKVDVQLKDNIVIEVADTGMGIPKHQQDKVFSKMFRADNAAKKEPDGTGLGLYIVKSILDAVGGHIEFTSSSKGTTFKVELPREGMKEHKGNRPLTAKAGV